MCTNPQINFGFVHTFAKEILKRKLKHKNLRILVFKPYELVIAQ